MDWFNWHRIGQMRLHWLIGSQLARLFIEGNHLSQLIFNWSNDTPLANWESIGMIRLLKEFISGSAPQSFPFIKGNDRGACLEMNSVL